MTTKKDKNTTTKDTGKDENNTQPKPDTSSIKPFKYTLKVDEFAMRGLNKFRNFLKAPECDCGCGGKALLCTDTEYNLREFCGEALFENGCVHSAIFLVYKSGKQRIIFTMSSVGYDEDEDEEFEYIESIGVVDDQDVYAFQKFDAMAVLHCYGMMIERDKGQWEICES